MQIEAQRCYVCGEVFLDKVKLGLHLGPCYNTAVTVRNEYWHPHPMDLVDEQRYTDYMRDKFQKREEQIKAAQRQGVSFVTAENFDAIRNTLGSRNLPVTTMGRLASADERTTSGGSPHLPKVSRPQTGINNGSSPQGSSPPPSIQSHRPREGITLLKNELTEELTKIRHLRETEEQLIGERQRLFEELCGQVGNIRLPQKGGSPSHAAPPPLAGPSPLRLVESVLPRPSSALRPLSSGASNGSRLPYAPQPTPTSQNKTFLPSSVSALPLPMEMPDGRLRCGGCGKYFGKKGYEVHSQRCLRSDDDFTHSRDAEFVRNNPENRVKADHDRISYGRQFEKNPDITPDEAGEKFSQFMVTYPRKVLEDNAKSSERLSISSQAQRNAYNQMVGNALSRGYGSPSVSVGESTVPCGRCGRYFYSSRLAKHEETCISKPKR